MYGSKAVYSAVKSINSGTQIPVLENELWQVPVVWPWGLKSSYFIRIFWGLNELTYKEPLKEHIVNARNYFITNLLGKEEPAKFFALEEQGKTFFSFFSTRLWYRIGVHNADCAFVGKTTLGLKDLNSNHCSYI